MSRDGPFSSIGEHVGDGVLGFAATGHFRQVRFADPPLNPKPETLEALYPSPYSMRE